LHLSPLIRDIIRADATYFVENGFISSRLHKLVLQWLEGRVDSSEVCRNVAKWLESDAQYFNSLATSLCQHHWYIYPLMWIMMRVVPKRLKAWASQIRREGIHGEKAQI